MKAEPFKGAGKTSACLAAFVFFLSGCSVSGIDDVSTKSASSKEYFAESEYGVKASPRVTSKRANLPRGGGRDQIGRAYKVKGKWYYPKEDPNYSKTGMASWYGDAFHGRLTANGEIYDLTHLTAAHPTMPLPSYARVINKANGSSIVVRVNDRGPFAKGRIIDLSRRAAELLNYTQKGLAKVDVEYLGRAPLHGQDDSFLLASYRPGNQIPDPSDGLPSGVMIAMNGPTPTIAPTALATQFLNQQAEPAPVLVASADDIGITLPDFGPIVPERPGFDIAAISSGVPVSIVNAYADDRVKRAAQAVDRFAQGSSTASVIAALNARYSNVTTSRAMPK